MNHESLDCSVEQRLIVRFTGDSFGGDCYEVFDGSWHDFSEQTDYDSAFVLVAYLNVEIDLIGNFKLRGLLETKRFE